MNVMMKQIITISFGLLFTVAAGCDGNGTSGDADQDSEADTPETCGNGVVDPGEQCEPGDTEACESSCDPPIDSTRTCNDQCEWEDCDPDPDLCCDPDAEEICNGEDDNCNDEIDEDFDCVMGSVEACTTDCGLDGTQICGSECTPGDCCADVASTTCAGDDCHFVFQIVHGLSPSFS